MSDVIKKTYTLLNIYKKWVKTTMINHIRGRFD